MSFSASSKTLQWLLRALILACLFFVFVLFQTPVRLVVEKVMPANGMLQDMTGTIFNGHGSWRYNVQTGTVAWQLRWLDMLFLRLGYRLEIKSASSHLSGNTSRPVVGGWLVSDLNGLMEGAFLSRLYADWPASTAIRLDKINLGWDPKKGFNKAAGQLRLDGGKFTFNNNGAAIGFVLPELIAKLSSKEGALLVDVVDTQNGRYMDLAITPDLMMDTRIHQRAVASLPQYQNMSPDSVVLSFKQPVMPSGAP